MIAILFGLLLGIFICLFIILKEVEIKSKAKSN
jgi:hypothetical protein